MNKIKIWIVIIIITIIFGCNNLSNDEKIDIPPNNGEVLAKVIIPLPKNTVSRSIGLGNARYYTNFFEIIFRRDDDGKYIYYSEQATSQDDSIEIQVHEGIYDILLLAGHQLGGSPILLASSYVQNANIEIDKINIISMELDTVDISINCSDEIEVGELFYPYILIDTKNPLIVFPGFSSNYIGLYYNGANPTEGINPSDQYNILSLDETNNNLYKFILPANVSLAAPNLSGTGNLKLLGAYRGFDTNETLGWLLASYISSTLGHFYRKDIIFIDNQIVNNVNIIITWREE